MKAVRDGTGTSHDGRDTVRGVRRMGRGRRAGRDVIDGQAITTKTSKAIQTIRGPGRSGPTGGGLFAWTTGGLGVPTRWHGGNPKWGFVNRRVHCGGLAGETEDDVGRFRALRSEVRRGCAGAFFLFQALVSRSGPELIGCTASNTQKLGARQDMQEKRKLGGGPAEQPRRPDFPPPPSSRFSQATLAKTGGNASLLGRRAHATEVLESASRPILSGGPSTLANPGTRGAKFDRPSVQRRLASSKQAFRF